MPIEIIKEVEVVKQIDIDSLMKMMQGMETVEVSKTLVGETRTEGKSTIVDSRQVKSGTYKHLYSKWDVKVTNLQVIEGIGPKIEEVLKKAGIKNFRSLSISTPSKLKSILEKAGSKYKMHDPTSWPEQAELAHKMDWDSLITLQRELDGGKEGGSKDTVSKLEKMMS